MGSLPPGQLTRRAPGPDSHARTRPREPAWLFCVRTPGEFEGVQVSSVRQLLETELLETELLETELLETELLETELLETELLETELLEPGRPATQTPWRSSWSS